MNIITYFKQLKPSAFFIYAISLLLVISFLVMSRQILTHGYFSVVNAATFSYTSWAWQFTNALQEGTIYPRWMPLDFAGYGSPTFLIYPPLAFYFAAFLALFTKSVVSAMNIAKFISLFLSSLGIFVLAKKFYPPVSALTAAISFIILPHTVFEYYLYGGFANTLSFIWFSPIMLCIYKHVTSQSAKHLLYGGIFYGCLLLTHIINAYMFLYVLFAFTIFLSRPQQLFRHLLALLFVIIIGCSLSSIYLLPLAFEREMVNLSSFTTKGSGLYYSDWFIYPNHTQYSKTHPFWSYYFDTVFTSIVYYCAIIFLLYICTKKFLNDLSGTPGYHVERLFAAICVATIFLLFGPSSFLWSYLPYFKFVHIPGRWLNITTYSMTFLIAYFSSLLYRASAISYRYSLVVVAIFVSSAIIDYQYIHKTPVYTDDELLPPKPINSSKDHPPINVDLNTISKDIATDERVLIVKGTGNAYVLEWDSEERLVKTSADEPMTVRFRTFNFPGWKVYLDSSETSLTSEKSTEAILVEVPRGEHQLRLVFSDTPVRRYGRSISISTFVLLSLSLIVIRFSTPSLPRQTH